MSHGSANTCRVGTAPEHFTPLQVKTLAVLRRSAEPVVFDPDVIDELCTEFAAAIAAFGERLDGEQLWISKHRLATVFGCEVQHLLDDPFEWSPQVAGGQVAHRAIELLLNRRVELPPAALVDEAFEQLADTERGLGPYLAGLPEGQRALLRSTAVERVINFQECFPPLPAATKVRTESSIKWPLDGPIVLSGKVDLLIGANEVGRESRKVIIDLKTGYVAARHRDDLRFYALVETLRAGVPPRKLASFYLDAGEAQPEDVTMGVLNAAARRTLDGINREIELRVEGAAPAKRPGPPCRWCPLGTSGECVEGATYRSGGGDDEFDAEP